MNAIFTLSVFVIISTSNECFFINKVMKPTGQTKPRGTKTNITIDSEYICTSDSKFREVKGIFSFESIVPCNGVVVVNVDQFFNVTFNDRKGTVKSLAFKDLKSHSYIVNGNEFFYASGPIKNSECAPGEVIISDFDAHPDCRACDSERGLTSIYTIEASFEIKSGTCKSKCYGTSRTYYNPGVKN